MEGESKKIKEQQPKTFLINRIKTQIRLDLNGQMCFICLHNTYTYQHKQREKVYIIPVPEISNTYCRHMKNARLSFGVLGKGGKEKRLLRYAHTVPTSYMYCTHIRRIQTSYTHVHSNPDTGTLTHTFCISLKPAKYSTALTTQASASMFYDTMTHNLD
jgi:hypothetical protein